MQCLFITLFQFACVIGQKVLYPFFHKQTILKSIIFSYVVFYLSIHLLLYDTMIKPYLVFAFISVVMFQGIFFSSLLGKNFHIPNILPGKPYFLPFYSLKRGV